MNKRLITIIAGVVVLGTGGLWLYALPPFESLPTSQQRTPIGLREVILFIPSEPSRQVAEDAAFLLGGRIVSSNTMGPNYELIFSSTNQFKDIPSVEAILRKHPEF